MRGNNLATANAASRAQRQARIEDAHYLRDTGEHPAHIAPRVGVSLSRLEEYLARPVTIPAGEDLEDDGQDGPIPALEPEHRIARAKPLAADLARCVAATDAEGVRLLLHRVRDWTALVIVLAECADPGRARVVTSTCEDTRDTRRRAAACRADSEAAA